MVKHEPGRNKSSIDTHPSLGSQAALKEAFAWFQEASDHLTQSYSQLENKVADLSGELAQLSETRMLELAEKEELADQLEHLLDLLPAGVVVLDGFGKITRLNQAAIDMLSNKSIEIRSSEGLLWRDLIKVCFKQDGADGHEATLQDGRKIGIALTALEKEPGQIILMTDLTETRRLQAKVSQSERLSSMGKMAASLAHQIRTPLSAALLYTENITKRTLSISQYQQFALKIGNRLRNIEQQIKDMMLFAKGEIQLNQSLDMQSLVEKVQLHSEVVLKQAQVSMKVTVPGFMLHQSVRCHESSLLGAIQNLINNAIEVSEEHTSIHFRISSEHLNYIKIEVIDAGPGLPNEKIHQLMEPFFSTKPKGTGLGLSVVGAVVRAHNGQFSLHNRAHTKGAIAEIILPSLPEKELRYEPMSSVDS